MARIDEDPEQRDKAPLVLENVVECPRCEAEFDGLFTAPEGIFEKEDLIEAPVAVLECPSCGLEAKFTYEGWISHEDAG